MDVSTAFRQAMMEAERIATALNGKRSGNRWMARCPSHDDKTPSLSISDAAFSLDGSQIVTLSDDNTARVWDAATGGLLHVVAGHEDSLQHVVFSPDGARVVTASMDNTAGVWDAATGSLLYTLKGHREGPDLESIVARGVRHAAFSPDGTRIVTSGGDATARVWDAATGAPLHALEGHKSSVYYASFSSDGTRLVTASGDDTVRVWKLPPSGQALIAHARSILPPSRRALTAEERRQFFLAQ
ncbi:MAG: hypothetical protein OES46_16325 [Gammaproteobacteria bacterium]|nr:hypothetical protein [Gammaproteobacteria bacterium]